MAPESGRKDPPVIDRLREEPWRFDFFQAVRLLERAAQEQDADAPGPRAPVGRDARPNDEIVRFRAWPSHSFPAGEIHSLGAAPSRPAQRNEPDAEAPPEMVISFMGLTGPAGVLPRHYTQLVIDRTRHKDFALADFLDLFHHRIVSLFYRAWEKYRFPIGYERVARCGDPRELDLFTWAIYCLTGMGAEALRGRLELDDPVFLYYSGYFSHRPRNALSLERMIEDYFRVPTRVLQFHGQWLYLSEEEQTQMPSPGFPLGRNNRLGVDAIVGRRVWSVESKFRIELGPLTYEQFQRFMPSGRLLAPLCQMVRTYVGPEYDFDVQPILMADEVPWCQLGKNGASPSRLQWNTWLRSRPFPRDADDAVFVNEGAPT
jgi:type VI secretion system protein ImpH